MRRATGGGHGGVATSSRTAGFSRQWMTFAAEPVVADPDRDRGARVDEQGVVLAPVLPAGVVRLVLGAGGVRAAAQGQRVADVLAADLGVARSPSPPSSPR